MRPVHFGSARREALKKATRCGEAERRRLPMASCFLVRHTPLHNYRHGIQNTSPLTFGIEREQVLPNSSTPIGSGTRETRRGTSFFSTIKNYRQKPLPEIPGSDFCQHTLGYQPRLSKHRGYALAVVTRSVTKKPTMNNTAPTTRCRKLSDRLILTSPSNAPLNVSPGMKPSTASKR